MWKETQNIIWFIQCHDEIIFHTFTITIEVEKEEEDSVTIKWKYIITNEIWKQFNAFSVTFEWGGEKVGIAKAKKDNLKIALKSFTTRFAVIARRKLLLLCS